MSTMLTFREWSSPLKLRYGDATFSIYVSEAQRAELGLKDEAIVDHVSVSESGCTLRIPEIKGKLRYESPGWKEFYSADVGEREGEAAIDVLNKFHQERLDRVAQQAADDIDNKRVTFEELRQRCPEVFNHSLIKDRLAVRFVEYGWKPDGRKPRTSPADLKKIYELCSQAESIQQIEGCSETEACKLAVDRNSDWPAEWKEGDPADNLYKHFRKNYLPLFR